MHQKEVTQLHLMTSVSICAQKYYMATIYY